MADTFIGGSAGTLVASALETAGLHYQSSILDAMHGPLAGIPVLLFVIIAIVTISVIIFTGRPQQPLLLVLGPLLFLAITGHRVPVSETQWRLGNSLGDQEQVQPLSESMTGERVSEPKVSAFFAHFDRITSSVMQTLIAQLGAARMNANLSLVARVQLDGYLMSQEISDPGLKELLHLSLLGECRGLSQAGAEMADVRNRPEDRCEWAKAYRQIADSTRFALTPQAKNYLARLYADIPSLQGVRVVPDLDDELLDIKDSLANGAYKYGPYNCDVNANAGTTIGLDDPTAIAEEAAQQTYAIRARIRAATGSRIGSSLDISKIQAEMDEREKLVQQREIELGGQTFHCDEIWNITYIALYYEAALTRDAAKEEARKKGIDPDLLMQDIAELSGPTNQSAILGAMARKIFRTEVTQGSTSAFIQEYAQRGPALTELGVRTDNDFASEMRRREKKTLWRDQGEMIALASSFPYYQGLILYFLSTLFPFFALLIMVPGQRNGFFIWCALWIWAKSWDVGYAVVTWVDEILRTLFVIRLDNGYLHERTTLDLDFSAALASLRDLDPSFDVSLYYTIIGSCLLAVPTLLSQILLAGMFSIGDSINERFRNHSRAVGYDSLKIGQSTGPSASVTPSVYGGGLSPATKGVPVSLTQLEQRERQIQNRYSQLLPIDSISTPQPPREENRSYPQTQSNSTHNSDKSNESEERLRIGGDVQTQDRAISPNSSKVPEFSTRQASERSPARTPGELK